MRLKIRNSEVISFRVSGEGYFKGMVRAENRKLSVGDYAKIAYLKYLGYTDEEVKTEFGDKEYDTKSE